jgi:hypothetical protein
MTPEEMVVEQIKKAISQFPEEQQKKINLLVDSFRAIIKTDEPNAIIAIALIGAEYSCLGGQ